MHKRKNVLIHPKTLYHLNRYQRLCKKDVLKKYIPILNLGESLIKDMNKNKKYKINMDDIKLLNSAELYLSIIDERFDKDRSNNPYSKNNYNVSLNSIPEEYRIK